MSERAERRRKLKEMVVKRTEAVVEEDTMISVPAHILHSFADSIGGLCRVVSKRSAVQDPLLHSQIPEIEKQMRILGALGRPEPSFTCFRRLPVELRIKVWVFALSEPRVVGLDVYCKVKKAEQGSSAPDEDEIYLVPTNAKHALPQVNMEARRESLKALSSLTQPTYLRKIVPKVYVNPELDTVWIQNLPAFLKSHGTGFRDNGIKRLAVFDYEWDWSPINDDEEPEAQYMDFLPFGNLEELHLIVSNADRGECIDPQLQVPICLPWGNMPRGIVCEPGQKQMTWEMLEAKAKGLIEDRVEDRDDLRQHCVSDGLILEDIDHWDGFGDLTRWSKVHIKYREVVVQ